MARRSIAGSRAIVTGASSGIGCAIAAELSRLGASVVVTARRGDRLEQQVGQLRAAGGQAHWVAGDITDAATRVTLLATAQSQLGGLDILVNNAGVGARVPFMQSDPGTLRRVMEVNFFAPAEMIREALPLLERGRRPIVVNVGSVLGHFAVPAKSAYCASKFALHGFSDALRAELAERGIDVLLVSPSTTRSEFFERALERPAGDARRAAWTAMPAAAVARKTVRAIRAGRQEIILSVGGKALVWLDRLCPAWTNRLLARFA